ncbi:MAG: hypothetical protein IRZ00_11215 [Gemmatimonadetes bacterium]|nr:hypothetical protein [Gemmatimonadota bacterium]
MLTQDEVLRLHQELGDRKVLSVYLNAEETDPAERRAWRIRLKQMVREIEARLAGDAAELKAFQEALGRLEDELSGYAGLLPERGWVGFATPERVWFAGASAAPMPDLVRWERGMHLAPYIRALKQARPVTVILADQRMARILDYRLGMLHEAERLVAEPEPRGRGAGAAKRAATTTGVRGEPRTDAARRQAAEAWRRLLREIVATAGRAGADGLLVVAGSADATAAIMRALPERLADRAMEVPGLTVDASGAEIRQAVDAAASELSLRLQRRLVADVLEATAAAGRACVGPEPTERALRAGAVETLVLSRGLTRVAPELVDRLVALALGQGAAVEEVAEVAAEALDREGGVGARLRYVA